ncbi:MAG TPA: CAP domain-containing protein [Candidatus Paceibacterota bacterium]|nr:CAP domain-containing protein [Candidatus Paceibacterota bacterium]
MRYSGLVILGIAVVLGGVFSWLEFSARPAAEPARDGMPEATETPGRTPVQTAVTGTPERSATPAPTVAPPAATPAPAPASQEQGLVAAMNAERSSRGTAALVPDATLNGLARAHAQDMAAKNYFSHTSPDGTTFQMRIAASGYSFATAAENIGLASSWTSIVPNWMNSEGHRNNILNAVHTRVGTGTAVGAYQGNQVVYAVAVFAAPQ